MYIFEHNHIIGCECWGYYLYKLFWGIPVRYHLTVHNMYGIMNDMCEQCGKHALNFLICGAMSPFDSIGVFFYTPIMETVDSI